MKNSLAPLESGQFYHIYNRGNNKETLFRNDGNYTFFLNKWRKYLSDYLEVWAYCLMPNHFHFLIQIKHKKDLAPYSKDQKTTDLLSNQFRKLFISYTKSFNKVHNRTGSLFQKRFKRKKLDSQNHLLHLIHYIHHNPIHHKFAGSYTDWLYSSYSAIAGEQPTQIVKQKVLDLFNGKDSFISYHQEMKNYNVIDHLIIEH